MNEDASRCYKCGSEQHRTAHCTQAPPADAPSGMFPFATCFICKQNGHLARSCPDNPRGLYPEGGGCRTCGSVEHFVRDCPLRLRLLLPCAEPTLPRQHAGGSADALDAALGSDAPPPPPPDDAGRPRHRVVRF